MLVVVGSSRLAPPKVHIVKMVKVDCTSVLNHLGGSRSETTRTTTISLPVYHYLCDFPAPLYARAGVRCIEGLGACVLACT
jgi:hypothetical protein